MNDVIYIFGASCSGKSTLAKALQNSLGSQWTYIDRDDLIEQGLCSDSTANKALEKKVQLIKNRVIIDAQIPWRKKGKGELYFLVLPSLKTLLERDTARTLKLKRTERRAYYAREYVKETYQILDKIEKTAFDYCFDSSKAFVQDEVNLIKTFIYDNSQCNLQIKYIYVAVAGLAFSLVCMLLYVNNSK